ncbi:predicted protein [Botrytis cinerea T4]|uniref:Uncharacterized protein n=1 Tax=Botryotinia fuckeliana (strain T4) TaxID=999810 RepID=G2YLG7_BOTF4|nr:predicted protein [Botrytis cinerea T4]
MSSVTIQKTPPKQYKKIEGFIPVLHETLPFKYP